MIPFFLVFLVFGVYANSLSNGFVSDDIPGIVQTAHTWTFPMSAVTGTVIHANILVWYVIHALVGLSPWAYRLVNIACHAVSVILVYKIVFQLVHRKDFTRAAGVCPERSRRIAFLASALFAVHPIIIESVTWIAGGVYTQYGMVFLLSFYFYIKGRELEDGTSRMVVEGRGSRRAENREQITDSRKQMGYYLA